MIRASASHDTNTSKEIGLTIVSSNRHRETLQYRITTRILTTCIRRSKRKRLKQEKFKYMYMYIHVIQYTLHVHVVNNCSCFVIGLTVRDNI